MDDYKAANGLEFQQFKNPQEKIHNFLKRVVYETRVEHKIIQEEKIK